MTGYLLDPNVPSELIPAPPSEKVVAIHPVTRAIADRWGRLDGEGQLAARPLNTADGVIAARALEYGLTVVIRNVKDFEHLDVWAVGCCPVGAAGVDLLLRSHVVLPFVV